MAILNKDDISFEYLSDRVKDLEPEVRTVTYGIQSVGDLAASEIVAHPQGIKFVALIGDEKVKIQSSLVGDYNVSNCLAAIAAAVVGLGVDASSAQKGIAALQGIPGRMEVLDRGQDFVTIVDFAHTPNALKRALQTARQLTSGQVIAVFGSAGLRDREKRRLMAEVSVQLADRTVLTAEDPRTESLDNILAEMAAGAKLKGGLEGDTFWRVPDRGEAIKFALRLAKPGDVVISCGKGHEQSMCFGEIEYSWDDRTAMEAALAEYLGISGPEMPYLPTREL